jgi:O-antigen/teichoic acid export membrane protein
MITRNFTYNFAGKLLPMVFMLVAVPIYIRYLGIANYALVGIFSSLSAFAGIFDTGFSNTINREMAKDSKAKDRRSDLGALFRTLEVFAWCVATGLGICVVALAGPIVRHWLAAENLPSLSLVHSVELIGLLLMLQAPTSFYNGALYGMHLHGTVNVLQIVNALLGAVAGIAVVVFVSPSISALFLTQFTCRLAVMLVSRHIVRRALLNQGHAEKLRVSWQVWRRVWRFAISMNGIGVMGLFASQADLVILSHMLPLREFGYYTLARTMAQGLPLIAGPVFVTSFPHMSQLFGRGEEEALLRLYHRYCQLLSVVVIPATVILSLYAYDVLMIWTRNQDVAEHAWPALTLLALGWGINSLGNAPAAFMLSRGLTRLIVVMNLANLVSIFPILVVLALHGAAGGALGVFLVNAFLLFVGMPIMHRWYLPHQFWRWIAGDLGLPLCAALIPAVALKFVVQIDPHSGFAILRLVLASTLSLGFAVLSLAEGRWGCARAYRFYFKGRERLDTSGFP